MAEIVNVTKTGSNVPLFTLVKGDKRTKQVRFIMPNIYAAVDLNELIWYISITNAEGTPDATALQKDTADGLALVWVCGPVVAGAVGLTEIYLEGYDKNGICQWASGKYYINVADKADDVEPGALTELQELISIAVVDVEEATARANEAAMKAEQMANKNGWLYVEGREDGHLYMITSDNQTKITMKDEEGRLIIVYG